MHFHPKSLFIALVLLCYCGNAWSQVTARHAALAAPPQKALPDHLRIAAHDDRPTTCWEFLWNDSIAAWDTTAKISFQYYPDGDQAQSTRQVYINGSWQNEDKFVTQFDNDHNVVQWFYFHWNGTSWDSTNRHNLEWNAQGDRTIDMQYDYNGASWDSVYGQRNTYTYHSGNLIAEQTYESYNQFTHSWDRDQRWVYHFTPQNEWDSVTIYYPNGLNQWVAGDRLVDVVFYDFPRQMLTSYRYQQFNFSWQDISRIHNDYGQFDSYVQIEEDYNATWDSAFKYIGNFDLHEHTVLLESYSFLPGWNLYVGDRWTNTYDGLGQLTEDVKEHYSNGGYQNDSRRIYDSFFAVGSLSPETRIITLQTWPNPVTDRLHIRPTLQRPSPAQLCLFDLQGRVQWQESARLSNVELEIEVPEELANGTYFLQIEAAEGRWMQKIVLMR